MVTGLNNLAMLVGSGGLNPPIEPERYSTPSADPPNLAVPPTIPGTGKQGSGGGFPLDPSEISLSGGNPTMSYDFGGGFFGGDGLSWLSRLLGAIGSGTSTYGSKLAQNPVAQHDYLADLYRERESRRRRNEEDAERARKQGEERQGEERQRRASEVTAAIAAAIAGR